MRIITKKILSLLLLTVLSASLCGCESEAQHQENINIFINKLDHDPTDVYRQSDKTQVEKYKNEEYFLTALGNKMTSLFSERDFDTANKILTNLHNAQFESQELQDIVKNAFNTTLDTVDKDNIADYIALIYEAQTIFGNSFYKLDESKLAASILSLAENHGEEIQTLNIPGTYYYGKDDSYVDTYDNWYDPLSKQYVRTGEIGTYRWITKFTLHGDIIEKVFTEEWWAPPGESNPATTSEYHYYWKDSAIDNNIAKYLIGNTAYAVKITDSQYYFVAEDDTYVYLLGSGVMQFKK